MKKIIVAALSVILVVLISLYFGSSTTGLFSGAETNPDHYGESEGTENSDWVVVGRVRIGLGDVSAMDS